MQAIGWLFKHNAQVLWKNKFRLLVLVGTPIISIIIYFFSYQSSDNISHLRIGVVNQDNGVYTAEVVKGLQANSDTKLLDYQTGKKKVINGNIDGLIVFHSGSNASLKEGKPRGFEIQTVRGAEISNQVKALLNNQISRTVKFVQLSDPEHSFQTYKEAYEHAKVTIKEQQVGVEKDTTIMMTSAIIGFFCMMLLYSAGNLGELIFQEKEDGTYYRLMAAPFTSRQYLTSNSLFALATLVFQIMLCLVGMKFVFHIEPGFSYLELFAILLIYAIMAVLLSLVFGFMAKNRTSVSALQMIVFTLPSLLSGALIPVSIMPAFMQKVAVFMPQYWVMDAIGEMQHDALSGRLLFAIFVLFAYSLLFASIAIYKHKHTEETHSFI